MNRLGVQAIPCHSVGTIIHMAIDGKYAGHIVISDIVKPHSKEAIQTLKSAGVRKTVMLTGDAKKVADSVASALGLDEVYSELLPADKVEKVEQLIQNKPEKEKLAFVGDGINDAPVLRRADIGIAMGAMGSDAAIEAADVVLMDDDPMQISKAIKISRKCLGIVYQNIVVAIGVNWSASCWSLWASPICGCRVCGCGRDDYSRPQRYPGTVCEKSLKFRNKQKQKGGPFPHEGFILNWSLRSMCQ